MDDSGSLSLNPGVANYSAVDPADSGFLNSFGLGDELRETFGINAMTLEDAKNVYGIYSAICVVLPLVLYMSLYKLVADRAFRFVAFSHQIVWFPSLVVYLVSFFFDSMMIRRLYEVAILITVTGPTVFNWYGFGQIMVYISVLSIWNQWQVYLFLGLYLIYMVFALFFQYLMLPKLFEWIEEAPIILNDSQQAIADGYQITDIDGHPLNDDHLNDPDLWGRDDGSFF